MSTQTLILVRHGVYTQPHGHGPFFIGHTDLPLNREGERQAEALGAKLASLQNTIVIASPLQRALKTAQIAFPQHPLVVSPFAKEIDFGAMERTSFSEAVLLYPEAIKGYPEQDFSAVGGETRAQLVRRAEKVVMLARSVVSSTTECVIVCSHAFFLDALCAVLEGAPERGYALGFDHCVPVDHSLHNGLSALSRAEVFEPELQ